jgi:hypothetical protein
VPLLAFENKNQKLLLSVNVQNRYGVQLTKIYKEDANYFCKTELTPYYQSLVKPYQDSTLELIMKEAGRSLAHSECNSIVNVKIMEGKKNKNFKGCSSFSGFSSLVKEINGNCGRN